MKRTIAVVVLVLAVGCGTDEPTGREGDVEAPCDDFMPPAYTVITPALLCVFDTDGLDYFDLGGFPVPEKGGGTGGVGRDGVDWHTEALTWTRDLGESGVALNLRDPAGTCVWRRCNSTRTP